MQIKRSYNTPNKFPGKNKKEFLILHHTGDYSLQSVINTFSSPNSKASCHFIVDKDGSIYAFEDTNTILWHCGESFWK